MESRFLPFFFFLLCVQCLRWSSLVMLFYKHYVENNGLHLLRVFLSRLLLLPAGSWIAVDASLLFISYCPHLKGDLSSCYCKGYGLKRKSKIEETEAVSAHVADFLLTC